MNTNTFKHDELLNQFILIKDNHKSYVEYYMKENIMYLVHSEVPIALRGKGVAKELVEESFRYIEKNKIEAIAICSYIKKIAKNPRWESIIK